MEAAPVGCFMMLAVPSDVFSSVITRWVDNRPNDWMIMESSMLQRSALSVKALSEFAIFSPYCLDYFIVRDIQDICQSVNYGNY